MTTNGQIRSQRDRARRSRNDNEGKWKSAPPVGDQSEGAVNFDPLIDHRKLVHWKSFTLESNSTVRASCECAEPASCTVVSRNQLRDSRRVQCTEERGGLADDHLRKLSLLVHDWCEPQVSVHFQLQPAARVGISTIRIWRRLGKAAYTSLLSSDTWIASRSSSLSS